MDVLQQVRGYIYPNEVELHQITIDGRIALGADSDFDGIPNVDELAGCSLDDALLAMDELAALHAPRWDDRTLANIEWLGQYDDPQSHQMIQSMYQGLWPRFVAQYGSALAASALRLGEEYGASLSGWRRSWTGPCCVTHGDYRLDNMMFGTEEGGYPLATVDWQTVGHGPGILDAAYFIGNGLRAPDRRAHEMELLNRYHDALVARGVSGYEWKLCLADYAGSSLRLCAQDDDD